jgi:hypothetical protein
MNKKIRIVQCLCPARHAFMGIAYLPGITSAQKELGGTEDITLTVENAAPYLQSIVESMIASGGLHARCGICGSTELVYEDRVTIFATMEEALPRLREEERMQRVTRLVIDAAGKGGAD